MSATPVKTLPGVFVTEQFPQTQAAAAVEGATEILIGPVRTVVPAEKGILGGPAFNTLAPRLAITPTQWQFSVKLGATPATAVITANFAGTVVSFSGSALKDIDDFIIALRTAFMAGVPGTLIKDIQTELTATAGLRKVTILASKTAIDAGNLPDMKFTVNTGGTSVIYDSALSVVADGTTSPGYLPVTIGSTTSVPLPDLAANWSGIVSKRVIEEVIYGLDASRQGEAFSEPERFYFDVTSRQGAALSAYLQLTAQQKAFYGDFTYVPDASAFAGGTLTVSKAPLAGTTRVTAISVRTGVEYELRLTYDYTVAGRTAGAYQEGDNVTLLSTGSGVTLAIFGTDPVLIRLSYIPDRYVAPLPVLNYVPLIQAASSVLSPMPLNRFTFDGAGSAVNLEHVDAPAAARFSYSGIANVTKTSGSLYADVNLAPRLSATVEVNVVGATDQTFDASALGTPNIVPNTVSVTNIVITRADGTVLTDTVQSGTDYAFDAATQIFTFYAAGANLPTAVASNPLTIKYFYVPKVTFVGTPTIKATVANGIANYTPELTHLGGGLYRVTTPGYVASATGSGGSGLVTPVTLTFAAPTDPTGTTAEGYGIASAGALASVVITKPGSKYTSAPAITVGGGATATATLGPAASSVVCTLQINATVEYPIQPQVQLEFAADRSDLDGTLRYFTGGDELAASTDFADVYASQDIAADLTTANPTLHAAAMALSVCAPTPVGVGVGTFTTGRIEKILNVLRSEENAYWLVPVTQDSAAALAFVGAHIDTMVSTIAGTTVNYAPGGFRTMQTTLDQRNENQIVPLAKDTTFGVGHLANYSGGGVAVVADLTGITGDTSKIQPGHYIEFYQSDATNSGALTGNTTYAKPIPRRLRIVTVDIAVLSAAKFVVIDDSLPPVLDTDGASDTTHFLKHGAPFRIIDVRADMDLATDIKTAAAAIGGEVNGERRWIMQPDIVVAEDLDGSAKALPGYYRAVLTEALRSTFLPNVSMSRYPVPRLLGVHRNEGFYVNDNALNVMTDGGVDYAVQRKAGGPVQSLQELTANRSTQLKQAPMVIQITDYSAKLYRDNLDPLISRMNLHDGSLAAVAGVINAGIETLKGTKQDDMRGPLILSGELQAVGRLPASATNPGIYVIVKEFVSEEVGNIYVTIAVDGASALPA